MSVIARPTNPAMDITLTVLDPDGTSTPYNVARAGGSEGVRFFPDETTTYTLKITGAGVTGDVALVVTSR